MFLVFLQRPCLCLLNIAAATALCQMAAAESPLTGNLELQVTVLFPDGKTRPGVDAVAWLPVPETRGAPSHRPTPQVVQRNKKFEPRVEVVSVGTEVAFPNLDPFYHNVFSLSEIAPFDLGLYRKGASRSVFFAQPGVVRIYCNIHPQMVAFLVVVPSQFFAKTNEAGQARLMGIPAGEHSLHLWHEMAGESQRAVTVVGGSLTRLHVTLDGSAYRPQKHKNKYGKDYPRPDDDDNRY